VVPLLKHAPKPVFVGITTGLASLGDMASLPVQSTAYGMSKAALNYAVRKIHFENEWLVAFVLSPGWVRTEMGNKGAEANGMERAPVTVDDSVKGMLVKIDNATREKTSGTFQSFDKTEFNW